LGKTQKRSEPCPHATSQCGRLPETDAAGQSSVCPTHPGNSRPGIQRSARRLFKQRETADLRIGGDSGP